MFYAQESIRFLRNSNPLALKIPLVAQLLWAPFWLLLLPILGVLVPVSATLLDPFDREQRFTVGYHVTAIRAPTGTRGVE